MIILKTFIIIFTNYTLFDEIGKTIDKNFRKFRDKIDRKIKVPNTNHDNSLPRQDKERTLSFLRLADHLCSIHMPSINNQCHRNSSVKETVNERGKGTFETSIPKRGLRKIRKFIHEKPIYREKYLHKKKATLILKFVTKNIKYVFWHGFRFILTQSWNSSI